jgi:hypothetical protein
MSAKKAEPALRAASDLLFERGWHDVRIAAYPDAGPKEPNAMLRAFAPGLPAQDLMITRRGDAFTIRRWDGVATVGKPIVAENAEALARALAEEPPPARRK